jgi:hypothetical protein
MASKVKDLKKARRAKKLKKKNNIKKNSNKKMKFSKNIYKDLNKASMDTETAVRMSYEMLNRSITSVLTIMDLNVNRIKTRTELFEEDTSILSILEQYDTFKSNILNTQNKIMDRISLLNSDNNPETYSENMLSIFDDFGDLQNDFTSELSAIIDQLKPELSEEDYFDLKSKLVGDTEDTNEDIELMSDEELQKIANLKSPEEYRGSINVQ